MCVCVCVCVCVDRRIVNKQLISVRVCSFLSLERGKHTSVSDNQAAIHGYCCLLDQRGDRHVGVAQPPHWTRYDRIQAPALCTQRTDNSGPVPDSLITAQLRPAKLAAAEKASSFCDKSLMTATNCARQSGP